MNHSTFQLIWDRTISNRSIVCDFRIDVLCANSIVYIIQIWCKWQTGKRLFTFLFANLFIVSLFSAGWLKEQFHIKFMRFRINKFIKATIFFKWNPYKKSIYLLFNVWCHNKAKCFQIKTIKHGCKYECMKICKEAM